MAAWRAVIGEHFWVGSRDEAVTAGLFGPDRDERRARAGSATWCARRSAGATSPTPGSSRPDLLTLVGMHGGLTPAELEVPLLVSRT